MRIFRQIAVLSVVVATLGLTALAQGPVQKRIDFKINVPYRLRLQNYMLPAGNYILQRISQVDPSMYALYEGDLRHSPVAMVVGDAGVGAGAAAEAGGGVLFGGGAGDVVAVGEEQAAVARNAAARPAISIFLFTW